MAKGEKLVRDRIPELSRQAGDGRVFRTAQENEKSAFMAAKILEEAAELAAEVTATPDRAKLLEELADVMEVITATAGMHGISPKEVMDRMIEKGEKKGRFLDWSILDLSTNIPRP